MDEKALGNSLEAQLMKALIAGGARLASTLAERMFRARGAFEGLTMQRDVAYGPDPGQRCEIWRADTTCGHAPLVLFLHGGGFQHLDPASHWAFAERFARAGAVVINAAYRLAPAHPYPAAADDAARAYAWAAREARALGADPEALVVAGTSAGANLALGLAITAREPAPRASVLFSGLLQVSDIGRLYRARRVAHPLRARMASIVCEYVGEHGFRCPEQADPRLDPLLFLERAAQLPAHFPPTFISTGSVDQVLEDAARLHACLAGRVPCALDVVPGAGHAFQGFVHRRAVRALWQRATTFLRAQGLALTPL